jgi:multimeric flavodoxin WrbA
MSANRTTVARRATGATGAVRAAGAKGPARPKKRVILLCGSPRPKGNTIQVLKECARVMKEKGVGAEIFSLAGKKILGCTACYRCHKEGRCILRDDLDPLIELLKDDRTRGFIVGAPVYFGSARGDVMNALQRIGMVNRSKGSFLSGKVGGPIAVARRGAHTATLQEMMMFFLISDMIIPGSTYWNMVIGRNPGEVWKDKEGMDTIRRFARNVAKLVIKLD